MNQLRSSTCYTEDLYECMILTFISNGLTRKNVFDKTSNHIGYQPFVFAFISHRQSTSRIMNASFIDKCRKLYFIKDDWRSVKDINSARGLIFS
jgi:hypothetical protein